MTKPSPVGYNQGRKTTTVAQSLSKKRNITTKKLIGKIVALLLAGAMAMLMFTACSGGGGSADTQKEEAIRKQLGTKTEAVKLCDNDGKVKNDSKLYKETAELLDARIKAETSAFGILLVDFDVKGVNPAEQYVTVTLSADYKTAGLVAGFVNLITEKLGKIDATNSNVKLDTEWAKAAVVVRTNEKGSYAAIAIQVKNLNYPKT